MLKIKKLNQFYGESHTLWDVNLSVISGSCTCLMGRNGVGKTTLLKAIMGLLPIISGEIEFDTNPLENKTAEFRARNGIGYVPQGREIFGQLTVEENLRIGLFSRKDGLREIPNLGYRPQNHAKHCHEQQRPVTRLEHRKSRHPAPRLSGLMRTEIG